MLYYLKFILRIFVDECFYCLSGINNVFGLKLINDLFWVVLLWYKKGIVGVSSVYCDFNR